MPRIVSILIILMILLGTVRTLRAGVHQIPAGFSVAILRLGKLHRVHGPGLVFVVPRIESLRLVDMRPQRHALTSFGISADGMRVRFDSVVTVTRTNVATDVLTGHLGGTFVVEGVTQTLARLASITSAEELMIDRSMYSVAPLLLLTDLLAPYGLAVNGLLVLDVRVPEAMVALVGAQSLQARHRQTVIYQAETHREAHLVSAATQREVADRLAMMTRRSSALAIELNRLDVLRAAAANGASALIADLRSDHAQSSNLLSTGDLRPFIESDN